MVDTELQFTDCSEGPTVLISDREFRVVFYNKQIERIAEYPSEREDVERTVNELFAQFMNRLEEHINNVRYNAQS